MLRLALTIVLATSLPLAAQVVRVGPAEGGEGAGTIVPTRQLIRPAGKSIEYKGRPVDLAMAPDGKTVYVANAGANNVSVVDVASRKEVAKIPVGEVPKRNGTVMVP